MKIKMLKTIVALILMQCYAITYAHPNFSGIIKKNTPLVVSITVKIKSGAKKQQKEQLQETLGSYSDLYLDDLTSRGGISKGTGFVIKNDQKTGLLSLLTSAHVIRNAKQIKVEFSNGEKMSAELIWTSRRDDVALLEVKNTRLLSSPLKMSENAVEDGMHVLSISGAFGLGLSSSTGIVAAQGVKLRKGQKGLLQTDAAINRGSSGGPLFDRNGEVLGLITNIYSSTGAFSGASFALPAKRLLELLDSKGWSSSNGK